MSELVCPACGSDLVATESCREYMQSQIRCCDCDFSLAGTLPEEDLQDLFKKITKKQAEGYCIDEY